MTLAAGTKLGRYEVRARIGAGGMGEVYLAEDTRLGRKVVLKCLCVEGESLRALLAREQIAIKRAVEFAAQAASGLAAAHKAGIIHRDIKGVRCISPKNPKFEP